MVYAKATSKVPKQHAKRCLSGGPLGLSRRNGGWGADGPHYAMQVRILPCSPGGAKN